VFTKEIIKDVHNNVIVDKYSLDYNERVYGQRANTIIWIARRIVTITNAF